MPPDPRASRGDAAFLWDMFDACELVARFIHDRSEADYTTDALVRSAVERQIEIIGEAARGLSDSLKAEHPEIPWRKIMAQRHVLAHEYGDVDPKLVWRVASVHIPVLHAQLRGLLPPRT